MKAEIISIGTELTNGQNLDTNCQWLSQQLARLGIFVGWHTTIADDLEANVEAFRIASKRAKLVLMTGGLGPTQDDLTREALAKAAGVELEFHQPSFDHIANLFTSRNRAMPDRNRLQAMFPTGADPIPNDHGTAPGVWMKIGEAYFGAMPGVPSEMKPMFESWVKPKVLKLGLSGGVVVIRKINCFGAGESTVEEKLGEVTKRDHVPEVGITASDATISLRIIAKAPTAEEAQQQIEPVEKTIRERLGELVFGVEDEQLQGIAMRLLLEQEKTIATAESVTAGLVASRLADVPGASASLMGGMVAYDNRIKIDLLSVPAELIEQHGVISSEVVEVMAKGVLERFDVDYGLTTVGIAGPGGGTPEKPVGLVFVGLAWKGGVLSRSFVWPGDRAQVRSRTAKMALNLLRLHLLGKLRIKC
ncbi:MAG: competence/damage-inducible protein A [Gemmataceae bacterium]